ncbi:MAG TPA: pitrilysin family protein [Roseiarcus sp.]|nr:pitrilysin family protein [Roseiarcus sp.]
MNKPMAAAAATSAVNVREIVSPGGVKAWLVEDYAVPIVSVELAFRGGASQDPKGRGGAATIFSGLLDEGAGDLDSQAFHRALDEKAIEIGFHADADKVGGRMRTLSRHLDRAGALLALALNAPRFDDEPFERVREQIKAHLRHESNDPDAAARRGFHARVFKGHAYQNPSDGAPETLDALQRADIGRLHQRLLARDQLFIGVVGALDAARAGRLLDETFAHLPAKAQLDPIGPAPFLGLGSEQVIDLDVPQTTIRFGRPGPTRQDENYIAAFVLAHILGGGTGLSSRLFREVREKRGLAYTAYAGLATQDHASYLTGGTTTKNERARESLDVIRAEILDMANNAVSEEELEKGKRYLVGSYPLRFDTSSKIAGQLVQMQLDGYGREWLVERNERIRAVSLADARRAAQALFGDGALSVVMVGRPAG